MWAGSGVGLRVLESGAESAIADLFVLMGAIATSIPIIAHVWERDADWGRVGKTLWFADNQ
jgi:hypothetical protein